MSSSLPTSGLAESETVPCHQHSFAACHSAVLPSASYSVPAESIQPTDAQQSSPLVPHLKLKITPVAVVFDPAPDNVKGKSIEDIVKAIVPKGDSVELTCQIDPTALFGVGPQHDRETICHVVARTVLGWLVANQDVLAIDKISGSLDAYITLAPTVAAHSYPSFLIPRGEPVAHLKKLHIDISWAYVPRMNRQSPSTGSQHRDNDRHTSLQVTSADLGGTSWTPGVPRMNCGVATSGLASPMQDAAPDDRCRKLCHELVTQVDKAMVLVLRLQLIRRFPFIFDGAFLQLRSSLNIPQSLLSATQRFLWLSAKYKTPLLPSCKRLLHQIEASQHQDLASRASAMAALPSYRPSKRPRDDLHIVVSTECQQISECLEGQRQQEYDTSNTRVKRILSQAISSIGVDKWTSARRSGRGKMSARRAELTGPSSTLPDVTFSLPPSPAPSENFPSFGHEDNMSDEDIEVDDEPLPPHCPPHAPRLSVTELPANHHPFGDQAVAITPPQSPIEHHVPVEDDLDSQYDVDAVGWNQLGLSGVSCGRELYHPACAYDWAPDTVDDLEMEDPMPDSYVPVYSTQDPSLQGSA